MRHNFQRQVQGLRYNRCPVHRRPVDTPAVRPRPLVATRSNQTSARITPTATPRSPSQRLGVIWDTA